jgi:hypothetical protein
MGSSDYFVTTTCGVNSAPATSGRTNLPFRAKVRHEEKWFAFKPYRRATPLTVTPETSVSATI